MDVVGITGLAVSICGFAVSLWQIARTKKAAEAAQLAAAGAFRAAQVQQAVIAIEQICGQSSQLLQLTRDRKLKAAAKAASELRFALQRFVSSNVQPTNSQCRLNNALAKLTRIHEALESFGETNRMAADQKLKMITDISEIHADLVGLTGYAAFSKTGE